MLKIETKGLQRAIKSLQELSENSERASMRAVNYAARRARPAGSKAIRKQVALKAPYVNQNLTVSQPATLKKPEAVISVRDRPTRLARFGAKQLLRPGPHAGGDPLRNIPAGRKQAGVSVRVKPGKTKRMRKAFLVPLRQKPEKAMSAEVAAGTFGAGRSRGKLWGVFIRTGRGVKEIKHLYGPSVGQVWRSARDDLSPDVRKDLASEYARQIRMLTRRSRGKK